MNVTSTSGRAQSGRTLDFRSILGLLAWVLLVPIVLAALGLWQWERASETLVSSSAALSELSDTLAQVKDIAKSDPTAMLTFQGDGEPTYLSALVAQSQIEDAIGRSNEELEISRIRAPLAWVTVGGAVLAFAGGAIGLITATISGMRARRSQRQLIKSFHRLRSILPFMLAAVVAGICGSVVAALLFETTSLGLWDDMTAGSAKLFVGALVVAVVAVYSAFMALRGLRHVFALFTPEPLDISGRAVSQTEAPELWRFARELASRQQALLPDTIIIGLTQGFFVTESQVRLWPEGKLLTGRSLYLPAPYLELLDEPEIATIIGHEFAHFSGEDTRYSQQFTPIYAGLGRALNALRRGDSGRFVLYPAVKLGFHAMEQFDHAVGHWSRLREFEADRNGSLLGSPDDSASALIRTGVIAPAVTHILGRAHAAAPQATPDSDPLNLVVAVRELARTEGWVDPVPLLEDRQPHPTDSHPPTIRRIAALGVDIDDALLARATRRPEPGVPSFAQGLFADWAGLSQRLSADFLDTAHKAHVRRRQALEQAVAAVTGEVVVYDNVKPMIWIMAVLTVIFAGFGLLVVVFPDQTGTGHEALAQGLIGAIASVGVLVCIVYAALLYRNSGKPLMVLTPDTLISSRLDRPLAWTDIGGYGVYATTRFALRVSLKRGVEMPRKDWRALYTRVDDKLRLVTLGALGVRGMKAAAFSDLVGQYHSAAYARQDLAKSKGEVSAG